MELTPQLLTDEIDFRIAVRGYDRHEVDDFLERVAVAVGQLQSQLTKAVARARDAEARLTESGDAAGAPAETPVEAKPEAVESEPEKAPAAEAAAVAEPPAPAPHLAPSSAVVVGDDEALNDELRRTLVLAQRTADTAIREARDEARGIVDDAHRQAQQMLEDADAESSRARDEARGRLVAEIGELEALRETMRNDTTILDRYLGSERARVRETIQVLRRLVDEPQSFRAEPMPRLSGVTTPPELEAAPEPESPVAEEATPEATDAASGDAAGGPAVASDAEESVPPSGSATPDDGRRDEGERAEGPSPAPWTGDGGATEAGNDEPTPDEPAASGDAPGAERTPPGDTRSSDVGEATAEYHATAESAPSPEEPAAEDRPAKVESDAERLGQLFDSGEGAKDWRSAEPARGDQGPHTQPVAAARFEEESDEAFLAELRRAMSDDEPLGPTEN